MTTISALQRINERRSRALFREGQRGRGYQLQSDKQTVVKAVLTRHAPGLSFFKKGDRNLILRAGGQHVGEFFISDYLPLRFDRKYAPAVLFYNPSAKYEAWKSLALGYTKRDDRGGAPFADTSQLEPLVLTGALRESALNRSYAVTRAAAGRFSVVVRIPTPATADGFRYSNNKEVRKVLRSLPNKEVRALANRLGRFIEHQIGQATLRMRVGTAKRKASASMRLQKVQRTTLREGTVRSTLRHRAPPRRTLMASTYERAAS
jgi:hypothetical protein